MSFWNGMEDSLGGTLGESGAWLKVIPEVERFGDQAFCWLAKWEPM